MEVDATSIISESVAPNFLFQKKHWNNGWAKALRNDPYCGGYINQAYLHRDLHSVIHDVPCPPGNICREVYQELCRQKRIGIIHDDDPVWIKLEWLALQFEEADCSITAQILRWQKFKIQKYYFYHQRQDSVEGLGETGLSDE